MRHRRIALVSLLPSTFHHSTSIGALRAQYEGPDSVSTATFVAGLFSLFGLFALPAVLFRL